MKRALLLFLAASMLMALSVRAMEEKFPLHVAVANNDQSEILSLLERGFFINQVDNLGLTPLQHASVTPNVELIKFLLDHGADARLLDNEGHTPLWQALSIEDNNAVVLLLLKHGAYQVYEDKDQKRRLANVFKANNRLKMLIEGDNKAIKRQLNRLTKKEEIKSFLYESFFLFVHYDNRDMIDFIFQQLAEYVDRNQMLDLFLRLAQIGNIELLKKFFLTIGFKDPVLEKAFLKAVEARKKETIEFFCRTGRIPLEMIQEAARQNADLEPILQESENLALEEGSEVQTGIDPQGPPNDLSPRQLDLSRHTFLI